MFENTPFRDQLKKAIIEFSYRENHSDPFTLASGQKSPYYFDLKQTLLQPQYLAIAGKLIAEAAIGMANGKAVLAGLTMGADPLIYSAVIFTAATQNLQAAIVRKEAKDHGTGKKIEMLKDLDRALPVVMVDDVITTAGSTLKAVHAMREAGFTVNHAVCILDRGEGGRNALQQNGIELTAIFTAEEFKGK